MDKGVSLVGVSYNERGLLQIRLMSMNGRTVGTDWYGTGRGTNFWYEILFGTARGIDFRTTYRTIKSRTKNPYNVPKSVPVRIFGTVPPSMLMWVSISYQFLDRRESSQFFRGAFYLYNEF